MSIIEPIAAYTRQSQRRMMLLAVGSTVLVLASTGLVGPIARSLPAHLATLWGRLSGAVAGLQFQTTGVSGIAGLIFLSAVAIIIVLLLTGRRDRARLVVRLARRGRPMPVLARRSGWSQDAVRTLIRLEGYERDNRQAPGKFFRVLGNSRPMNRFAAWAGKGLTSYGKVE